HNEDIAPPAVSFAAPTRPAQAQPMMPASIGPPPARPAQPSTPPAPQRAHDPFAPPDAHEAELKVELAPDERQRVAGPIGNPGGAAAPPPRPMGPTTPVLQRKPLPASKQGVTRLPSSHSSNLPRWHFAAGVATAIILGFIPAHIVASVRESSADKAIDAEVVEAQTRADTPELYAALDSMRTAQESRKKSEHRNIALVSLLLWAIAGAGVGFVWFRQIPWDRVIKS
ncbi:MAG: hypothetical protein KIT31_42990, partial [Deltaproteobacteria bacterium]|nr:hypothetical protein [Deltaproteobacteria bacterium]